MRALVCEAYGPIENLKIVDLAVPEPKPDEVLIRVGAAGVSFAAMLGVQGKHQNKPALPYVPGNEMAGHIVKLGAGVTHLSIGQRIATGVSQGAFAEFAVATAGNAVPIPEIIPMRRRPTSDSIRRPGALKWKADMQPGRCCWCMARAAARPDGDRVGKAMGAIVMPSAGGTDKLAAARVPAPTI